MKLLSVLFGLLSLTLCLPAEGQKWKKIFDFVEDLRFSEMQANENGTTTIITRTSFSDHRATIINQYGEKISDVIFQLSMTSFRPFDYLSLGNGDFAVLCRSNIVSSDVVRVIKFNENGQEYWSQNLFSEEYDLRPNALSLLEDGNIAAMGIAQKYINSNDDQEIFMIVLASEDGDLLHNFSSDTPAQYSTGVRIQKADNGNYICIEGENFDNVINVYGGLGIRSYFINEIDPEGEIINRVRLGEWTASNPHQNHLEYLSSDSIIVVTDRDVYLLNSEFNTTWHKKTDLSILDIKVDRSKSIIAITGRTFGSVDNAGSSILLLDFDGNIISSKTHPTASQIVSSADEMGINFVDEGYSIAYVKTYDSNLFYLECLRTDEMASIDNYEVFDIFSTCDLFPIPIPNFEIPDYECNESAQFSTNIKTSNSDIACTFLTFSEKITTIRRIVTDSCGTVDTVIQLIHYEEIIPTVNCCDYTILNQNADGAFVQFSPITVNSPCRSYDLVHLDSFDLTGEIYFETGSHEINFLLVNDDCSRLDSFYQTFTIDITFVDEDGDGFDASVDCNDMDENVNPDQIENPYNGIDDDCDPSTLDDDLDQDGFLIIDDCNDLDSTIYPGAIEIPDNDIDEDCDGFDLITNVYETDEKVIHIYPNPASELLLIHIDGTFDFKVMMYDIQGRLIVEDENVKNIQLDGFSDGTYLLALLDLNSGKKYLKKIIVSK